MPQRPAAAAPETQFSEERMDQELEKRLRVLLDKDEIRDLLLRYCRGIDRGDVELVDQAYHPDAVDDHGEYLLAGKDVGAFFVNMRKGGPRFSSTHLLGNALIEVEGDRAYAESYFVAVR